MIAHNRNTYDVLITIMNLEFHTSEEIYVFKANIILFYHLVVLVITSTITLNKCNKNRTYDFWNAKMVGPLHA